MLEQALAVSASFVTRNRDFCHVLFSEILLDSVCLRGWRKRNRHCDDEEEHERNTGPLFLPEGELYYLFLVFAQNCICLHNSGFW